LPGEELRTNNQELVKTMNEFERTVLADLATLKAEMKILLGNGQPGRLRQLESRVEQHEQIVQRASGIGALLGVVLTLVHLGIDWLKLRSGR
jgi:hypothetical protein